MSDTWLVELEAAVLSRNPLLAEKLQPGLTKSQIQKQLKRGGVDEGVAPLLQMYSWRNGTVLDRDYVSAKLGFFPQRQFHFTELGRAIGDLDFFKQASKNHPRIKEVVGRYFPLFWDGATDWLAIDLESTAQYRVMVIEFHADSPCQEAYGSFNEFIAAVIQANIENRGLTCFGK